MKKIFLPIVAIVTLLTSFSSCKKADNISTEINVDDRISSQMINEFFAKNAPQTETFSLDVSIGGTITLASGTKINFPPNVFANNAGVPVTGNVDLSIRDILKPSSMILGNKPTATADGKMLESFGEIIVNAAQNNNPLQVRPQQKPIMVQVPIGGGNANGGVRDIPMWDGDTTISTTQNGYNHENESVSITHTISVNKGIGWTQIPGFGIASNSNTIFPLDAFGQWRNCDALYNDPRPKTTVLGYFGSAFNSETGNNYSGVDPTMLFFKTAGTNTLIKLYNAILNPAPGKEGLLSYQNSIPIGQQGTFLAISAKNGKFYAEMRDVTIPTPAVGKNYVGYTFNLSEVSESQLLNLINQMNTK